MKANFFKILEDSFGPNLPQSTEAVSYLTLFFHACKKMMVTHVLWILQGEKGAQGPQGFKVTLCYKLPFQAHSRLTTTFCTKEAENTQNIVIKVLSNQIKQSNWS